MPNSLIGSSIDVDVRFQTSFTDSNNNVTYIDQSLYAASFTSTNGVEVNNQPVSYSYQDGYGFTQTISGNISIDIQDSGLVLSFNGTTQPTSLYYDFSGLATGNSPGIATAAVASKSITPNDGKDTISPQVIDSDHVNFGFFLAGFDPGSSLTQTDAVTFVSAAPAAAAYSISASPTSVVEGDVGGNVITYSVSRTGAAGAATIPITFGGTAAGPSSANPDYSTAGLDNNGALVFAANATTASFTVTSIGDRTYENDETVVANLGAPSDGGSLTTSSATATLTNDDPPPVFSIANAPTVTEGGQLVYAVTRTGDAQGTESVVVTTGDGTATAGQDYAAATQTLSFGQGVTTADFVVNTTDDALFEGAAPETVTATLSAATGGSTISTTSGSATGSIADNDAAPVLSIGPANLAVAEGNSGTTPFAFAVTRTGDAQADQTVAYAVTGSGTSPATADDFVGGVLPTGTVTFLSGETTRTITVPVMGDGAAEATDGFTVTLSGQNFGTVSQATATGSIVNDDAAPDPGTSPSTTPSSGSDVLTGAPGNDIIVGQGGNDTIQGSSGNGLLLGNQGNDVITAGDGMNTVYGGMDNDAITAGNGDNVLFGNEGSDTIKAGNGNNTIVGGNDSTDGADVIASGTGNDLILGNGGNDVVSSGAGNDSVVGGFGDDVLLGNQGNDVVLGNQGNDTIYGGQGADTIYGGMGDDVLVGGEGDDLLFGNQGANQFQFNVGDTGFVSGTGTGDIVGDFKSGTDTLDVGAGPAGSASNFGSGIVTGGSFAALQAAAQQLLTSGATYAFETDGTDGYLFTNAGTVSGSPIDDAIKLSGVTSLQASDIT